MFKSQTAVEEDHDDGPADLTDIYNLLVDTQEYTQKIHSWVQFFGVLTCIGLVLAFIGLLIGPLVQTSESSTSPICLSNPSSVFCD